MVRLTALVIIAQLLSAADDIASLRHTFAEPPDDARVMMRWWWFGPAVTHAELEREMRAMKIGGIGGFEVQPVYPLALDNPATRLRDLRFLSPEFLDALQFTGRKARELGLRFRSDSRSGRRLEVPPSRSPKRPDVCGSRKFTQTGKLVFRFCARASR